MATTDPRLAAGNVRLAYDIQARRERYDRAVKLWGAAVTLTTLALLAALLGLLYGLVPKLRPGLPAGLHLLAVTPLITALLFSLTSYSRARNCRDKFAAKEILARSLPASMRLLREEYPDFARERLQFTLHNMQAVYDDAIPPKKRSYNIGVNKIFRLGWSEDDTPTAKAKVIEGATTAPTNKVLKKL